jgi:preprotein translocase subunit SecA
MASGDELEAMREETLTKLISSVRQTVALSDQKEIIGAFATIVPFDDASKEQLEKQIAQYTSPEEQMSFLETLVTDLYAKREESVTPALMRQIERFVHLSVIDKFWMDHLDAMDNLRQGIGLRGYGQRDPLVEYKNEGYRMFESLLSAIDDEISHRILKIQVAQQPPVDVQTISTTDTIKKSKPKKTAPTLTQAVSSITDASGPKKLGRNDPCWCGSGKKWKKCHYPS